MAFFNVIGRERVAARCRELTEYLRDQLTSVETIERLTTSDRAASAALLAYALRKGTRMFGTG